VSASDLPTVNAILNAIATIFLLLGYVKIKRRQRIAHQRLMIAAVISSALFLITYLIYHSQVGSVPYPHYDWTRPLYFIILIPHVVLAAVMVPFILLALWHALHQRFEKHRSLTRWVWPVWMFVSVSGIAVYVMLYLR
jgi:uncharacterized membrane protein YozB (DUF420 family)